MTADCHRLARPGDDKSLGRVTHGFSSNVAIARMRLREYFGRPALIELPVLNELLPASTWAGTRLRSTGTLSNSFFFSNRSLSTASAMKAVAIDFLGSVGFGCSTARNLPNCITWLM